MYAAEHAAEHPDQPAIIMAPSGRTLTFAEYEAGANQVAHVLRETGLKKGDHMAIFMENHPAVLLAEAGAERTGLYFTPVNFYLSAEEVAYVVNDSRSRVVVTSTARADVAAQLPALCPDVERWIMVDTSADGNGTGSVDAPFESWDDTVGAQPTDHVADEQMGAPMMYSSGTTGRPKGILRPMYDIHPSETSIGVLGIAGLWRLREGMVYLSPAPLYHTAPQVSVAIASDGNGIILAAQAKGTGNCWYVIDNSATETATGPYANLTGATLTPGTAYGEAKAATSCTASLPPATSATVSYSAAGFPNL